LLPIEENKNKHIYKKIKKKARGKIKTNQIKTIQKMQSQKRIIDQKSQNSRQNTNKAHILLKSEHNCTKIEIKNENKHKIVLLEHQTQR
jgi:hypothetical protein